jgi:sigma-54 dependent transcriptional regulator, flagellar regulatory protein
MIVTEQLNSNESIVDQMIIGRSPAIVALKAMIKRVAPSSASVMIMGPSGAGKEVVAQAIHALSKRSKKSFVALNCGAISPELIESELFGHERGAFTGAATRRTGRFEEADKGTLFLDEIGDMRFDMQVKLLRVLETGIIQRVGGGAQVDVDVRIVSATHQNLDEAIAANRFREDLYFRLGVVPVCVPDLASRVEDIPLLIDYFERNKKGPRLRFDRDAMAMLMAHDWPGNVRELRNLVERANILLAGRTINAAALRELLGSRRGQPHRLAAQVPAQSITVSSVPASDGTPVDLKALLETMELERIQMALDVADGVISEAARMLTLKRTTLIEKMRKYGV